MNHVNHETVRLVAEALMHYNFRVWNWGDSIGFSGLLAADELLGGGRYSDFTYGIAKGWMARRHPFRLEDQTVAGAALCRLVVREGDNHLLSALRDVVSFLRSRRRTAHGVFEHFHDTPVAGTTSAGEGPGVFVDCMHFDGPFFASLAALADDRDLTEEAVRQLSGQIELLQDAETGLFHHFWLERTGRSNHIAWGRGQGWALHGIASTLEVLPTETEGRELLRDAFVRGVEAMAAHQLPSGGWHTIVDDSAAYEETSTACFMAATVLSGIRQGLLSADYTSMAYRAWRRARDLADAQGMVRGTSDGTPPGFSAAHYRSIGCDVIVPWGQGPFLVAASEVIRAASVSNAESVTLEGDHV